MEQLTTTKFFLTLQEASQKGVDQNTQSLKREYDNFVALLFAKWNVPSVDKPAYHNTLVYTRMELADLTGVSKKKYNLR